MTGFDRVEFANSVREEILYALGGEGAPTRELLVKALRALDALGEEVSSLNEALERFI